MPIQVRERKRNGTTKCDSIIAAVRPTQPLLASQTQRTSNSSAAASSGVASSTDGSQSNGAPQEVSREIPAIAIANGKELRIRVRLASENAASSASTEANPKPAKKSKIRGDGNPTRVGNGSSYENRTSSLRPYLNDNNVYNRNEHLHLRRIRPPRSLDFCG
jgi:hypothetical protein